MTTKYIIGLLYIFNILFFIYAGNHWVLNENGKILPKIDSPFYLREPNNLVSFLDQIKHNDIVETTYLDLLRQRELLIDQINFSIQFGVELIEQAKCAFDFYDLGNSVTYTKITKKYLKRISTKKKYELLFESNLPICSNYLDFNIGLCCFDHLKSLMNTKSLHIEPENELKDEELEFDSEYFVPNLIAGLENNPTSWKYHTLSSYYWRMRGNVFQAIECARRGILLAPRKFKDIPLLSLGTILWRSEKLKDAEIILSAAVDHAPHIPENHLVFGTALAMLHSYNRSIEHFEIAEKLDPMYKTKINNLKSFVLCLENLNKKTAQIYSYVEYIKQEVNGLKNMKNKIVSSHEKLIQQQVPLGARYLDIGTTNDELRHRGQYCSTRTLAGTDEPVLFCDFYSELQMRLESKEVDIDSLEREINANANAIKQRLSVEFTSQFNFEKGTDKSSSKEA